MTILLHYFYQAICYLPFSLAMLVMLLYSPALAFFPQLLRSPLTFAAIPIVSMTMLNIIAYGLFHAGIYTHTIILSISLLLFIIAIIRQYFHVSENLWDNSSKFFLLTNIALILPLVAIGGFSAFMWDDALVSWNRWAHDYYLNLSPAPLMRGYPPFFPLFLSYSYKFLGTFEYQGAVKALLAIFPFTLLNCIAFCSPKKSTSFWLYLLLICISIFPGFLSLDFYRFYSVGYADPLLAAAITTSAMLLLRYCEEEKILLLVLAVISGIAASLTKQPGFLWALLGFPAILITKLFKQRYIKTNIKIIELLALFVLIIPALLWICGPGKNFAHNMGVIDTSLGTDILTVGVLLKTLWRSILHYWIFEPGLFLLYIFAFFSLRTLYQKVLFWIFIIPGTILWFIFGAYNVRLGLHLLTLCALLIAYNNYLNIFHAQNTQLWKQPIKKRIIILLSVCFFIFFSIREQNVQHHGVSNHRYPLNASKTIIYQYFSTGAEKVYQDIFTHKTPKLWIPSYYITPIFYGNNILILPPQNTDLNIILLHIIKTQPDYLFSSGKFYSPASVALLKLATLCPELFQEIPLGTPIYHYRLFKLKPDTLSENQCATTLDVQRTHTEV